MTEEFYRDREFSVATDFSVFSIEVSLSRQSLPVWCRDTALWCRDRVGLAERCHDRARAIERSRQRAQCARTVHTTEPAIVHYVVHCLGVTVHGHC